MLRGAGHVPVRPPGVVVPGCAWPSTHRRSLRRFQTDPARNLKLRVLPSLSQPPAFGEVSSFSTQKKRVALIDRLSMLPNLWTREASSRCASPEARAQPTSMACRGNLNAGNGDSTEG